MVRMLTRRDVQKALPMWQAVEAVKDAFAQLSSGQADVPLRATLDVPRHNGVTLFMPGYLSADDAMALKVVSIYHDNPDKDLPLIHALVVVVDAETGAPAAVMDGTYLTALRTGAASGAATDLLAGPMPVLLPSFFKSVGVAVQDVATAAAVLKAAEALGVGTAVEL